MRGLLSAVRQFALRGRIRDKKTSRQQDNFKLIFLWPYLVPPDGRPRKLNEFEQEVEGMSYHRDLTLEIAALDDLIETHLKRLEAKASPDQVAILNELKQILTLKKELLRKLIIASDLNQRQKKAEAGRFVSDEIH